MNQGPSVSLVFNSSCLLGEGPVWDDREKSIIWIDILNGLIHEYDTAQNEHKVIHVHDMIGSLALSADGHFIAALKNGIATVNRKYGNIHYVIHPEKHLEANRYNDGKCDPTGRFWVGSMALSESKGAGNLYRIEKDLSHSLKIQNVSISNGMAWTHDHSTFYYIDSPSLQVWAFNYEPETGNITNKKVALQFSEKDGFPDGMTIDSEDRLWIAFWDGWKIERYDPIEGKKLLTISLPVARVTSCTFGGPELDDLYITTAKNGLHEQELVEQPLAGALFIVKKCGYKGFAADRFDKVLY